MRVPGDGVNADEPRVDGREEIVVTGGVGVRVAVEDLGEEEEGVEEDVGVCGGVEDLGGGRRRKPGGARETLLCRGRLGAVNTWGRIEEVKEIM